MIKCAGLLDVEWEVDVELNAIQLIFSFTPTEGRKIPANIMSSFDAAIMQIEAGSSASTPESDGETPEDVEVARGDDDD